MQPEPTPPDKLQQAKSDLEQRKQQYQAIKQEQTNFHQQAQERLQGYANSLRQIEIDAARLQGIIEALTPETQPEPATEPQPPTN